MERDSQELVLPALERFARALRDGAAGEAIWRELERSLTEVFGLRLFTVLAYDEASSRLGRLYSNRPDINAVGGVKRATQSPWTERVLQRGEIFRGSTREDIRSVFSDYEVLWSIGCESVLNIPVRKGGVTLGTLNLLGEARLYDHADLGVALVFAQLAVASLDASIGMLRELAVPDRMEQV